MKTQKITPEHWRQYLDGTLPRPAGEDFFLFEVSFDTPSDPCWNDSFSIIGDWKGCCRIFNSKLLVEDQSRYARLAIFQGDDARKQILHNLAEEVRYRQERRSIPNN